MIGGSKINMPPVETPLKLTVEEYKHMRIFERMSDSDILEKFFFSRVYRRKLQKWKKENGLGKGGGRTALLDPDQVREYLKNNTITKAAIDFNIGYAIFKNWLVKEGIINELNEVICSTKRINGTD
jgi:hypothetical protein